MKLISMTDKEYRNIHDWIRRRKKHITNCEKCGGKESVLDNALIHGKIHEKNLDNYIKLCRKCHYMYDHPEGYKHSQKAKIKISLSSKKRIKNNGVSENFVNSRLGVNISEEHKKRISISMSGENHHQSKLTEEDVKSIRCSSLKPAELARKHNVTYRTINNIIKRKTWKHLD